MSLNLRLTAVFEAIANAVKGRISTTEKGAANGVATLDGAGKVPASQLPSYVDDVIEYATMAALPAVGEGGKIYVVIEDDTQHRWSGSNYINIATGEVSRAEFNTVAGQASAATAAITTLSDNIGNTDTDFVAAFNTALNA